MQFTHNKTYKIISELFGGDISYIPELNKYLLSQTRFINKIEYATNAFIENKEDIDVQHIKKVIKKINDSFDKINT